jgi:phosphomannomutase
MIKYAPHLIQHSTCVNTMTEILIADLMSESNVGFGTSGARGLVADMTDRVCYAYATGFLQYLEQQGLAAGSDVVIAGDYRPSSPHILSALAQAIHDRGYRVINGGFVPSPAAAHFGFTRRIPSMMVTGSHIPDDRNGIKFNTTEGEILKQDELGMREQRVRIPAAITPAPLPPVNEDVYRHYVRRYLDVWGPDALAGLRIGLYEHSTVARDALYDILSGLGAMVERLGRSTRFVPVDTEAIRPEDVALAEAWARATPYHSIVSADGDGDRPLLSDEHGQWLRGDIVGILVSRYLQAEAVATPVSCNSAVEKCGHFRHIYRTRIGSPFVIGGMMQARIDGYQRVVGYEANGGFLTGTSLQYNNSTLAVLPTRDAVLPILAVLLASKQQNVPISALAKALPPRFTASDRLKNFPTVRSAAIIASLTADPAQIPRFFQQQFGVLATLDTTDGLRITWGNGDIVHLRPSGNAPEFRCYTEANTAEQAAQLLTKALSCIQAASA